MSKLQSLSSPDKLDKHAHQVLPNGCLIDKQCEICGITEITSNKLVRDHSHTTGRLRGMLCSSCNARIGHYETGVLFDRFRKSYEHWLELYSNKIKEYLEKPSTGVVYSKSVKDEETGFSIRQLKQQARSNKSVYGEAARKRLTELSITY